MLKIFVKNLSNWQLKKKNNINNKNNRNENENEEEDKFKKGDKKVNDESEKLKN